MIAPIPPAAYKTAGGVFVVSCLRGNGHATTLRAIVVATLEPDGPPRRNDARVTVRPAPAGLPPVAAKEKLTKTRRPSNVQAPRRKSQIE